MSVKPYAWPHLVPTLAQSFWTPLAESRSGSPSISFHYRLCIPLQTHIHLHAGYHSLQPSASASPSFAQLFLEVCNSCPDFSTFKDAFFWGLLSGSRAGNRWHDPACLSIAWMTDLRRPCVLRSARQDVAEAALGADAASSAVLTHRPAHLCHNSGYIPQCCHAPGWLA